MDDFIQVDLEDCRSVTSERAKVRQNESLQKIYLYFKEMAQELGLPYYETSAATGEGKQIF